MAQHHVVCGLGFGDEGKGSIVDYLCESHRPDYVVRFNGGAQAAHNVVLPDGRHHCFAQFGSGAFWGTGTFLSRFMLVNPLTMMAERQALIRVGARGQGMFVDERALVTTPYHMHLNRKREVENRHGSCGMGIGETMRLHEKGIHVTVGDLRRGDRTTLRALDALWEAAEEPAGLPSPEHLLGLYSEWLLTVHITGPDWLERQVTSGARLVFEGAQGLLLDPIHGWMPNCTWSNCTAGNAITLLREAGVAPDQYKVLGVLRAYHTRHGAGPFPTEIQGAALLPDHNNRAHPYQGSFRWGHFDAVLARYALSIVQPDGLVLTHLDLMPEDKIFRYADTYNAYHQIEGVSAKGLSVPWKPDPVHGEPMIKEVSVAPTGFEMHQPLRRIAMEIQKILRVDSNFIHIGSFGPTHKDKILEPLLW